MRTGDQKSQTVNEKLDVEDYRWLYDQIRVHIMHEDELLEYRTSLFITATSILIGAYSLSFAASSSYLTFATWFRIIISVSGALITIIWEGTVIRTQSANEMWKSKARDLEAEIKNEIPAYDRILRIYTSHAERFTKTGMKKFRTHGLSTGRSWRFVPVIFLSLWTVMLIINEFL
ncbi:MAG: hypothetical protein QW597_04535 [Thermoplasmataceae archaeon]